MLLPRDGVVYTFVIENQEQKKITDFVSFYRLPSTVLKKTGHNHDHVNVRKKLNFPQVAYSLYNVATANKLHELMKYALIEARNQGFDVFNALNIMENALFLEELKFAAGDGKLNYYLYNWNVKGRLVPSDIGVVLV